jgi:hypothetical protein
MSKSLLKKVFTLIFIFGLITACAPSPQLIQTAIAQTQAANPTSTFTPLPPTETSTLTPSETPTKTQTIIPSPTPDLLLLQLNLKDFLLQLSDIPQDAHYISIYNSLSRTPNEKVDSSLVIDTGRLDGWNIWYSKDYSNGGWYVVLSDGLSLYQTSVGAQLAVTKYSQNTLTEEINPPKIGDLTRAFYSIGDTGTQASYEIIFAYRNCVHIVGDFGWENEVVGFTRNIARILLAKLQASMLINP